MTSEPSKINEELINYFQDCLNNHETSDLNTQIELLQNIPKIISDEDNRSLNKPFSLEEIKVALFIINPDKSPGLDGFQAFFYISKMLGYNQGRTMDKHRSMEVASLKKLTIPS